MYTFIIYPKLQVKFLISCKSNSEEIQRYVKLGKVS